MNDTPEEVSRIYTKIILSKTYQERFRMGLDMTDTGWKLMASGIKMNKPGISDKEVNIEILKRLRLYDNNLSWLDYLTLW